MGAINQEYNPNGFSLQPGQTFNNPSASYGGVPGVGGANPAAPTYSTRPQPNGPAAPPAFGQPGWQGTFSAPGGYNPSQYADDNTANTLAQALGGTVNRTKTLGPFGDFGQNQINFGPGQDYNAGLLAERYAKYDRATADAMTAAERNMGPAVTDPNAGARFMNINGPTTTHTPAPATAAPADGAPAPAPTNPWGPVNLRGYRGGFGRASAFGSANPFSFNNLENMLLGGGGNMGYRTRSNPFGNGGSMAGFANLLNGLRYSGLLNNYGGQGFGGLTNAGPTRMNQQQDFTIPAPQGGAPLEQFDNLASPESYLKMLGNGVMDRSMGPGSNPFNTQYGGTMGALNTGNWASPYPQFQFDPSTSGFSQGPDGRWNLSDGGWSIGMNRYDRNGNLIAV